MSWRMLQPDLTKPAANRLTVESVGFGITKLTRTRLTMKGAVAFWAVIWARTPLVSRLAVLPRKVSGPPL